MCPCKTTKQMIQEVIFLGRLQMSSQQEFTYISLGELSFPALPVISVPKGQDVAWEGCLAKKCAHLSYNLLNICWRLLEYVGVCWSHVSGFVGGLSWPECAFESQVDRLLTLDAEANLCRFAALSVAILVTVRTGSDGKISMIFGMNGRMSILLPAVLPSYLPNLSIYLSN